MAILYKATLVPSKLELMTSWLTSQPWIEGIDATAVSAVGAYRFDDPDGEVGIETYLLKSADGTTIQVPLTYRSAPLDGADSFLVGTTEHSVLGTRWVYDGCGDVVFVRSLASTILEGGHEAPLDVVSDDGLVRRETTTRVQGSGDGATGVRIGGPVTSETRGSATYVRTTELEIALYRVIDEDHVDDHRNTLSGTWPGQSHPVTLASLLTTKR
jgi:hypothetical protein